MGKLVFERELIRIDAGRGHPTIGFLDEVEGFLVMISARDLPRFVAPSSGKDEVGMGGNGCGPAATPALVCPQSTKTRQPTSAGVEPARSKPVAERVCFPRRRSDSPERCHRPAAAHPAVDWKVYRHLIPGPIAPFHLPIVLAREAGIQVGRRPFPAAAVRGAGRDRKTQVLNIKGHASRKCYSAFRASAMVVRNWEGDWWRVSPHGIIFSAGKVRYSKRLDRVTATNALRRSSAISGSRLAR